MALAKKYKCKAFINTCSFFVKNLSKSALNYNMHMMEYTLSKFQFRQWGSYMSTEEDVLFINMQLEHVYGLDDRKGKFVPTLIDAMINGQKSFDLSSGNQNRDWIAVEDDARAYSYVIDNIIDGTITCNTDFEVGTGKVRSVRRFTEIVKNAMCSDIVLNWGARTDKLDEIGYSKADTTLLNKIGWFPSICRDEDIIDYFSKMR